MDVLSEIFTERVIVRDTIATVILLAGVLLLRSAALRAVRRAKWGSEDIRLRWTAQVRWTAFLFLSLGLVVIWSSELRTLAFSVVAIAAAIVIATKELIMCVSGSILRATSGAFSVGDRIEIDGIRGDVVEVGLLTTTLLEIGPSHRHTGRAVVVPNSLMFSNAVTNETVTEEFVLHTIAIPVSEEGLQAAEERLLEIGADVCRPLIEDARQHMNAAAKRHNLPVLSVDPIVSLQVPEAGKFTLLLRIPTRARDKGHTERQVLRRFFELRDDSPSAIKGSPSD